MLNFVKRIFGKKEKYFEVLKKSPVIALNSFREGMILEMSAGYHTRKPYYVEVIYFNPQAGYGDIIMTTNIPGKHSLDMRIGNNWEYHYRRMTFIGYKREFGHLLKNQKF